MRSIPMIVLGAAFIVGGALIAWLSYQKPKPSEPGAPVKKSELRAQEAEQAVMTKQRLGGAILAAIGVVLILLAA